MSEIRQWRLEVAFYAQTPESADERRQLAERFERVTRGVVTTFFPEGVISATVSLAHTCQTEEDLPL